MVNIVWDLDGVLRDLNKVIEERLKIKIKTWGWKYKSKNVFQVIKDNPDILEIAPPTEYYELVKDKPVRIWTRQPDDWILPTVNWIQKYLPKSEIRFFGVNESKESALTAEDVYIVEDYPKFKNYDRVILIDRPYNKNVQTSIRVHSVVELSKAFDLKVGI